MSANLVLPRFSPRDQGPIECATYINFKMALLSEYWPDHLEGVLKLGPIALVDETIPVVVIAPLDELTEKTVSNMQEVAALGDGIAFANRTLRQMDQVYLSLALLHPILWREGEFWV